MYEVRQKCRNIEGKCGLAWRVGGLLLIVSVAIVVEWHWHGFLGRLEYCENRDLSAQPTVSIQLMLLFFRIWEYPQWIQRRVVLVALVDLD